MNSGEQTSQVVLWTGNVFSAVSILFLVFDGATKVMRVPQVTEASEKLGIPTDVIPGIGVLLLLCTALYAVPQTAVLGAILLTAYLGGATAIHVRAGSALFPILFSVIVGVLVWGGLYLREPRLLDLIPIRK